MDNRLYIVNMLWTGKNQELSPGPEHEHTVRVEQSLRFLGFELYSLDRVEDDVPVSFWSLERDTKRFRRYPDVPKEFKPGTANSNAIKSDEWLLHQDKKGRMYVQNDKHDEKMAYAYIPNAVERKHMDEVESAFQKLDMKKIVSSNEIMVHMDKKDKQLTTKYWLIDFINKEFSRSSHNESSIYLPTEGSTGFLHRVRGKVHSRDFGI